MSKLTGKRVAILATNGFEESELLEPKKALESEGAKTTVVSLKTGSIQGMKHDQKGKTVDVDLTLESANAGDFDALVLPGGVANPDALRMNEKAVELVAAFVRANKPIAAICHGPWTLIETGVVKGKTMTSWPSLKTDLTNAGAKWIDKEVVTDGNVVTSRKPDDIPAFVKALMDLLVKGAKRETSSHAQA
ncbi:MAG TPA: type 1 glutamine amidotransferase domain-containing protein [Polyangiaceae bacterium]